MINEIFNGDSASEIRAKLNEMITIVNYYSSSQWPDMGPGPGGDPGPGGGGDPYATTTTTMYYPPSGDTTEIWSTGMASPFPSADPPSACLTVNMNYSHNVYLQKDPMNMAGTVVPEVNDYIYEDSMLTMPLQSGYYGWRDTAMGMNKFIGVGPMGNITEVNYCA